jgi:Ca2+-binding EF-hand superfamily protein
MGCSSSRYVVDINTDGQGIDCQRVLNLLKFNDKEVNQLYRCFVKYDLSNDGKLSILEFLTMLDIGMTWRYFLSFPH